MSAAAVLQELRSRLGLLESPSQRETFSFSRFPGGLPRGGLVEISGFGKTESVAAFLAENPQLRAAWVESRFSLLPSALQQRGVDLSKIFFVEGKEQSAWAATLLLRSQIFPAIVYQAPPPPRPREAEKELRRFQLLAERSATTMFLLNEEPLQEAWPIRLSLTCEGARLTARRRR